MLPSTPGLRLRTVCNFRILQLALVFFLHLAYMLPHKSDERKVHCTETAIAWHSRHGSGLQLVRRP